MDTQALKTLLQTIKDPKDRALARRLYWFVRRSGVGGWDNYTMDNPHEMAAEEREELATSHGFRNFEHWSRVTEDFADARNRMKGGK